MVEHVVLFKVKSGVASEAVAEMIAALRGLRDQVPGIADLTVGANFSDRNQGYTHGLVVRFRDKAALEAYLPHAAHQAAVQNCIRPIVDDVLVVDYEI